MSRIKKIAFFVTYLDSGGIENYLLRFLTNYTKNINATVYCKSGEYGSLAPKYKSLGVNIIKFKLGMFSLIDYIKLFKELRLKKYDSVVDFTGNFAGLVLLVSKVAGIENRISFYRGSTNHFEETYFKLFYNNLMNKLTLKYSSKILSNSIAALDFFYPYRSIQNPKFKVIYNGIDANKFITKNNYSKSDFNIPENAFVIGHTGRYNSAKNHKTIIQVANKLIASNNNIYFVLVGKDTEKLSSEIKNTLSENVKILGYRNDINKILPIFDLFFFPSTTEGQPNSLIEAMVIGLPIVASNIAPIKETTPILLHSHLKNPFDVDGFIEKIEYINQFRNQPNIKNWAIKKFDSKKLFNKFYMEL